MRLTIQLIEQSPQYINAFKQRELDLRSHRIAIIENMGATKVSQSRIIESTLLFNN